MDAAYGTHAKTIFESALYARRVVENVLEASQGRHTQLEQWDFYQVVRDALDLTRPAIPPEMIMTEDLSAIPPGSALVVVNKTDVMRAVSNVIKNAVQAMQDNSVSLAKPEANMTLHITSRRMTVARRMANVYDINPGEYVELSIRDTGPGMDAKTQSRIFEPFFSTKSQSGNEAHHPKGTGLGLAMVYAIMKQSDGTIIVKSAPGEGATFRLLFPVAQAKAQAA
jgi:signal transduction histidine kinase